MLKKQKPRKKAPTKPASALDRIRSFAARDIRKVASPSLLPKVLLGTAIVVIAAGGAVAATRLLRHNQPARPSSSATNNKNPSSATKCSLPTVDVKANAFSVGVPKGWLYELNNGTVSVMKDKGNTTGAFLYTAKLSKDLAATEFLTASAGFFSKAVADEGGTFKVDNVKAETSGASGTITASLGGVGITGLFNVQKESDFVTLRAYYAPKTDISKMRGTLEQITACYARTTKLTDDDLAAAKASQDAVNNPAGFSRYQGRYFNTLVPSGFKVTGESDSGLDMSRSDTAAGFSYAYVTGARGPYSPGSWAQYALPHFASIQSLSLGAGRSVASKVPGMTVQEFDFTGSLGGTTAVKGRVTAGVINTTNFGLGSSTSAFWAIQVAKPAVWPSVSSLLQQVQNSVAITNIGDTRRSTMLPPNRPMDSPSSSTSITSKSSYGESVSDEASQGWADGMRGYQEVKSPSTGQEYDVPLNAWDPSGSEGAGYYRSLPGGGTEKLE